MLSLVIALLWCMTFVSSWIKELPCPEGTNRIGSKNDDIAGCGLEACDDRYNTANIDACRDKCQARLDCRYHFHGHHWVEIEIILERQSVPFMIM